MKREGGFSLIELAIIMIIMGVLLIPLMDNYRNYQQELQNNKTYESLKAVENALGEFFILNGYYPCPSDRALAFGDANHGRQNCGTSLGAGTCTTDNGLCKISATPLPILEGGVPYADLNIPYTDTTDGHGNLIKYAISEDFALPARAFVQGRTGSITLERVTYSEGVPAPITTTETGVQYLLVSPGRNGKGAFSLGGEGNNCTGLGGQTADEENCDGDRVYRTSPLALVNDNTYFDDRVSSRTGEALSIWEQSTQTAGAIYNSNPGPVGVGTKSPDPDVRLDVVGDIQADEMRSDVYCDRNGQNCFRTSIIAGNGIECPAGQYLIGVAENRPVCRAISLSVPANQNCPAGQFVIGINNRGIIQCGNL